MSDALWKHSTATAAFLSDSGSGSIGIVLQRLVGARRQERPPPLAIRRQPFAGDAIRVTLGRSEQRVEGRRREPRLDLGPQRIEVEPARAVVAGEVDDVPDPVDVDRRVLAVVLQQRDRDAGNRRGFHVGKGALEDRQAADADDRVDLARLNQRHDQRRTFGDEHRVAEALRFLLQILNRAQAALLAEQPELVERRRALVFDAQALGQQQQPAVERNRRQMFAPDFVVEQDPDIVAVLGVHAAELDDGVGLDAQLVEDERRHERVAPRVDVAGDDGRAAARARRASAECWPAAAAAASPA